MKRAVEIIAILALICNLYKNNLTQAKHLVSLLVGLFLTIFNYNYNL
jgi:hypothetical protein